MVKELLEGFKEQWAPVMENLDIADQVGGPPAAALQVQTRRSWVRRRAAPHRRFGGQGHEDKCCVLESAPVGEGPSLAGCARWSGPGAALASPGVQIGLDSCRCWLAKASGLQSVAPPVAVLCVPRHHTLPAPSHRASCRRAAAASHPASLGPRPLLPTTAATARSLAAQAFEDIDGLLEGPEGFDASTSVWHQTGALSYECAGQLGTAHRAYHQAGRRPWPSNVHVFPERQPRQKTWWPPRPLLLFPPLARLA